MAGGRPTDYRPEYCQKAIELGKTGASYAEIASELDVAESTLYLWKDVHPEFSEALTRARQEAKVWFERLGRENLTADRFQSSLWAKQVSCRFPDDYREKQAVEHSGNITVVTSIPSPPNGE